MKDENLHSNYRYLTRSVTSTKWQKTGTTNERREPPFQLHYQKCNINETAKTTNERRECPVQLNAKNCDVKLQEPPTKIKNFHSTPKTRTEIPSERQQLPTFNEKYCYSMTKLFL